MVKLLGTFGKTARGQTVAPQKYYMVELPAMKLLATKLLAVVKMSRGVKRGLRIWMEKNMIGPD